MNGLFLSLIYFTLFFTGKTQPTKTPHHYYYLKGFEQGAYSVETGTYNIDADKLVKIPYKGDEAHWKADLMKEMGAMPEGKRSILFYLHGYMADNPTFVKESGYIMQKEYFDREESQYGMVISLQWNAPPDYRKSRGLALDKGKAFASLVDELYRISIENRITPEFSFFCHSMGNRVFEGLYTHWAAINPDHQSDNIFLLAADLEYDIFADRFSSLPSRANQIYIYNNLNDRTLAMANVFVPYKRLGIFGPDNESFQAANVHVVDVSDMDDDETFAGRMSLHRYYYGSPGVRAKIRAQMAAGVTVE